MYRRPDRHAGLRPRRGVSLLEFVGCTSAMLGGVLLGSLYLGVDVKHMAYCALERAQLIDDQRSTGVAAEPASAVEEAPGASAADAKAVDASNDAPPAADSAAPLPSSEPLAPRETPAPTAEPAAAASPIPSAPAPESVEPPPAAPAAGLFAREDLLTEAQRQALTLAYWDALSACMSQEREIRNPAVDEGGNWQLFDYLTNRKDGHLQAAAAIAHLDRRGVDDHVLAYAKKARQWHEDGARLFGRAVDLLTDAPTAQLSGPFAQSWQSAATQHRMEERLLAEKHQAVQSYLDHAYPPQVVAAGEPAGSEGSP